MNTENIIEAFKQRAQDKTATFADHIVYAIARAYKHAESEGEANYLSTKYVLSMVRPVSEKRAACELNGDKYGKLNGTLKRLRHYFGKRAVLQSGFSSLNSQLASLVDNGDVETFGKACARLEEATSRHYVYIFVRQDIIPEQQAVQAAHVTMVAGERMSGKRFNNKPFNPSSTHFVLIGVPDEAGVVEASRLSDLGGIPNHLFYEEDMGNQVTAMCTDVVTHDKRATFREYGLLKMKPTPKAAMRSLIDWVS